MLNNVINKNIKLLTYIQLFFWNACFFPCSNLVLKLHLVFYTKTSMQKKKKVFCKTLNAFSIEKAYGIEATVSQQPTLTSVNGIQSLKKNSTAKPYIFSVLNTDIK